MRGFYDNMFSPVYVPQSMGRNTHTHTLQWDDMIFDGDTFHILACV